VYDETGISTHISHRSVALCELITMHKR